MENTLTPYDDMSETLANYLNKQITRRQLVDRIQKYVEDLDDILSGTSIGKHINYTLVPILENNEVPEDSRAVSDNAFFAYLTSFYLLGREVKMNQYRFSNKEYKVFVHSSYENFMVKLLEVFEESTNSNEVRKEYFGDLLGYGNSDVNIVKSKMIFEEKALEVTSTYGVGNGYAIDQMHQLHRTIAIKQGELEVELDHAIAINSLIIESNNRMARKESLPKILEDQYAVYIQEKTKLVGNWIEPEDINTNVPVNKDFVVAYANFRALVLEYLDEYHPDKPDLPKDIRNIISSFNNMGVKKTIKKLNGEPHE